MSETTKDVTLEEARVEVKKPPDRGGRRRKADRRRRTTAGIFPERRWLRHRRNGGDRRGLPFFSRRMGVERREAFKETEWEKEGQ